MDIDIAYENEALWQETPADWFVAQLEKTAESLFAHEKIDIRQCELSVVLADDAHIQSLNASYRDKDKPTNILSFPLQDDRETDVFSGPLGDLVLAAETCVREAEELDISLQDHLAHLLLHGILHLVGFDHMTADEADDMESIEIGILESWGIKNPYADGELAVY